MEELELLSHISLQYNIPCKKVQLIRHNENMTYCIDDTYLLRIHKSKPGFNTTFYYQFSDLSMIHENELKFLEHLKDCGLYLQSPIRNINNELVTILKDGTVATMLTWLPGRIVEKSDITEDFSYELGNMVGKLHQAAKDYHSDDFICYDQKLCKRLIKLLTEYLNEGILDMRYYKAMTHALEVIGHKLQASEAEHILLHSDLSLSNILITKEGLAPIDFSLLGYSNTMLDFGSMYCFVDEVHCRKSIIKGYEAITGIKVEENEIEYYLAFQILLGIVMHYELWVKEEWFTKRLPEWCQNEFIPLT